MGQHILAATSGIGAVAVLIAIGGLGFAVGTDTAPPFAAVLCGATGGLCIVLVACLSHD